MLPRYQILELLEEFWWFLVSHWGRSQETICSLCRWGFAQDIMKYHIGIWDDGLLEKFLNLCTDLCFNFGNLIVKLCFGVYNPGCKNASPIGKTTRWGSHMNDGGRTEMAWVEAAFCIGSCAAFGAMKLWSGIHSTIVEARVKLWVVFAGRSLLLASAKLTVYLVDKKLKQIYTIYYQSTTNRVTKLDQTINTKWKNQVK